MSALKEWTEQGERERSAYRLLMAGSSCHGMLVAPNTKTPVESFPTPLIYISSFSKRHTWMRSSVLIRLLASDSPSPLVPVNESISSMKMIAGFCSRAMVKSCLTNLSSAPPWLQTYRSDSPIHLLTRSDDEILKKVLLASVATAFARKLLPVPGGPYSRIPLHGVLLPVKSCGNLMGRITASFSASLACARPATSSHATLGDSLIMAFDRP